MDKNELAEHVILTIITAGCLALSKQIGQFFLAIIKKIGLYFFTFIKFIIKCLKGFISKVFKQYSLEQLDGVLSDKFLTKADFEKRVVSIEDRLNKLTDLIKSNDKRTPQ